MIRLFVAIAPPREMRSRLSSLCGGVPAARWVDPAAPVDVGLSSLARRTLDLATGPRVQGVLFAAEGDLPG